MAPPPIAPTGAVGGATRNGYTPVHTLQKDKRYRAPRAYAMQERSGGGGAVGVSGSGPRVRRRWLARDRPSTPWSGASMPIEPDWQRRPCWWWWRRWARGTGPDSDGELRAPGRDRSRTRMLLGLGWLASCFDAWRRAWTWRTYCSMNLRMYSFHRLAV